MSGDKAARILAVLAVLAVAVVAGIVSFSHIETLGLMHGYALGTARLLPVSVDGLIVASSMALLTGATPGLAHAGLVLGIVATLAANVAAGAEFGAVGAVVNAWPAVAFIVASEILLGMLRAARDVPPAFEAGDTVAAVIPTAPVRELDTVADVPVKTAGSGTGVPDSGPVDVPDPVTPVVPPVAPVRARGQARRRTTKQPAPERLFAAEIESGQLPSLREVKRRAGCGTPRAQAILAKLADLIQEAVPEAA